MRTVMVVMTLMAVGRVAAGTEEPPVDFARDVAPIFQQHCIRCHRPETRKGEISLSTGADLRGNGHIVVGKPDESDLLTLVTPAGGKREIEMLEVKLKPDHRGGQSAQRIN